MDVVMLAFSLGLILFSSVVFTNGIELLGSRLKMNQGATGSILAAVGTALPETVIPVIAILVYHDNTAHLVGIGAIAGSPFMLGTLAFFVTGAAVMIYAMLGRRTMTMHIEPEVVVRDLTFFVGLYGVAVLTTFVHGIVPLRCALAAGVCISYIFYVRQTLHSKGLGHEEVDALHLSRMLGVKETGTWITVQMVISLLIMVLGAHMFVGYVKNVSFAMGVSALVLSIIITPIATELPEKCNSVIWVGRRKDIMALGNITGAMVFQSSFPVAFGMMFTPWDLRGAPMVSAGLALASAIMVLIWVKVRKSISPYLLMTGGLFYGVFIAYLCLRAPAS